MSEELANQVVKKVHELCEIINKELIPQTPKIYFYCCQCEKKVLVTEIDIAFGGVKGEFLDIHLKTGCGHILLDPIRLKVLEVKRWFGE